jgi:hypothetical protein
MVCRTFNAVVPAEAVSWSQMRIIMHDELERTRFGIRLDGPKKTIKIQYQIVAISGILLDIST